MSNEDRSILAFTVEDNAPEVAAKLPIPDSFDFTIHPDVMHPDIRNAYYLLRRKAMLANNDNGDPDLLPDGKVMTRAEVETALGSTIEEARIGKHCC